MDNKLDYTDQQEIEYNKKKYLYNPYLMGVGLWSEKTASGKSGKIAAKELQRILNRKAFGYDELPNIEDRMRNASGEQKKRMKQTSVEWLQSKINLIKMGYQVVPDSHSSSISGFQGRMFFYEYDPKTKNTLPMWDKYPLVIILEQYSDGFLALNLHYASSGDRTKLLTSLLRNRIYNPELNILKVNIDHERFSTAMKTYPGFKQCIKRYLSRHIQGRALEIKPHEWGLAIVLPIEDFHYNTINKKRKK